MNVEEMTTPNLVREFARLKANPVRLNSYIKRLDEVVDELRKRRVLD